MYLLRASLAPFSTFFRFNTSVLLNCGHFPTLTLSLVHSHLYHETQTQNEIQFRSVSRAGCIRNTYVLHIHTSCDCSLNNIVLIVTHNIKFLLDFILFSSNFEGVISLKSEKRFRFSPSTLKNFFLHLWQVFKSASVI
jgi:hypothetical protein